MVANGSEQRRKAVVVARWRASGLSQAEFCRREGLEQWRLSEWKRSVAVRDAQSQEDVPTAERAPDGTRNAARTRNQGERTVRRASRAKHTAAETMGDQPFVPVQLVGVDEDGTKSGAASALECVLEVVLRSGQTIRVGHNCEPQFLREVVAILNN
jgi:hypothetical protein